MANRASNYAVLVASTFIGSVYVLSEKAHVSMEWIYTIFYPKKI